ncbi:J domain-containing protein [Nostoc sp. LEGE 12450]|uniref:J domain-containing protein n=1 Tax=Nostoc sp. LEGE 12450 TaxID=1828643 RepID=UPI001D143803|nr:J domain-containing protein [Nostoc sp. LEGE 12450]
MCNRFGVNYVTEVRTNETGTLLGYGVCVDSLHQESQARFNPNDWANDVIIIDECDQVFWHLLNSGTEVQKRRVSVLKNLKQLVQNVLGSSQGKIYLSSADVSDTDVPAQDTEAAIALTFSEAFHGTQKRLQIDGETITVRIPPGVKSGSRIRVKGKGQMSPFSQQRADLYLTIELLPHPFFKFEGDNLACELPVSPEEAVLGAQIDVPTPDGKVTMTIPSGVDSGQALRLRGKGWRDPKGNRTALIVRLKIVTPKDLSPQERECYEKLRQVSSFNSRQGLTEVRL